MTIFTVQIATKNSFGGITPDCVTATHYKIHPCGALEFYNEGVYSNEPVRIYANGLWTKVTAAK